MLPHAPRNIVSAEATPKLATVRALGNLTMAFPPNKFRGRTRSIAKRKNAVEQ
jgi:hypothetical protein